jgi:hypothetical protein
MGKMKGSQTLFLVAASLMIGWSLNSFFHLFESTKVQQSGSHLLHQVVIFQLELLSLSFNESANLKSTQELNILKQAAFSVEYTHERFLLSLGSNKAVALHSMTRLMDYILRLQMGGDRPLKPEEIKVFQDVEKLVKQLSQDYAKLMTSYDDRIIASENDKVIKTDEVIVEFLSRKLLQ